MFGKKNNLEKKIKLNISSKDLESDFKKRLLSQQSSSDLKGFRKGKAPLDVIEKYYGDQIKQRLIMDKMGDIFYKKISEENIPVVGQHCVRRPRNSRIIQGGPGADGWSGGRHSRRRRSQQHDRHSPLPSLQPPTLCCLPLNQPTNG